MKRKPFWREIVKKKKTTLFFFPLWLLQDVQGMGQDIGLYSRPVAFCSKKELWVLNWNSIETGVYWQEKSEKSTGEQDAFL